MLEEPGLRERLAAAARPSVAHLSVDAVYGGSSRSSPRPPVPDAKPRVLFVGRGRYRLPLPGWLAKKWDAIEEVIDYRVLGAAEAGGATRSERFRLSPPARPAALDGALF